jgi:hypothetical protein
VAAEIVLAPSGRVRPEADFGGALISSEGEMRGDGIFFLLCGGRSRSAKSLQLEMSRAAAVCNYISFSELLCKANDLSLAGIPKPHVCLSRHRNALLIPFKRQRDLHSNYQCSSTKRRLSS